MSESTRQEIVNKFFEHGYLLTPDALEFLEKSKNYEKLLDEIKITDKFIIDKNDFAKLEPAETEKIKILKNLTTKPANLTTNDFIRFYNSKYEKMRDIITERVKKDFISFDKLDNSRNEVYVIGIVKEIRTEDNKKIIELEDLTGLITVVFDKEVDFEPDDVIAIRGVSGRPLIGKDIIYPDIPLRQPIKGTGKICVMSDLHLEEAPLDALINFLKWFKNQNIRYLLVTGDVVDLDRFNKLVSEYIPDKTVFLIPGNTDPVVGSEYPSLPIDIVTDAPLVRHGLTNDNIISLSNPSMIEINNIKILLIHSFEQNMLNKRYLGKSKLILNEDYLVLDYVPDIVVCGHTHEPFVANYKSVTIVNPGSLLTEFRPTVVDLATREWEQLRF